jgi:CRISPR-associated protein Cas1
MSAVPLSEALPDAPPDAPSRAKHLPLRLPAAPPDLVPARMINEVLYCERLLYLEWAQGEFQDNHFTVEGRTVHRRADTPGGELPPRPGKEAGSRSAEEEEEERPYQARSVWLSSEKLGITAKIDIVEGETGGRVVPIEYKRGKPPDVPEGAYLPERAQLCAQVLVLRDQGYACDEAALYFAAAKRRVPIAIDDALIETTLRAVARARELAGRGQIPPPLENSPKCLGCSLAGICLPDEVQLLRTLADGEVRGPGGTTEGAVEPVGPAADAPAGEGAGDEASIRRLHPARDDKLPVYAQEQGGRIGVSGECLVLTARDGGTTEARLPNTSHVNVFGNVQVSTQALRALCERGIPLFLFTVGGFFVGRLTSHDSNNVELRIAQHRAAADPSVCLALARRFIASKIRNCRTLLRRNLTQADAVRLSELEQAAKKAERTDSLASLLGIEGAAARAYFGSFSGMLTEQARGMGFDLDGRNRRPPRDPVNALLSFLYALLSKEWTRALTVAGLDPLLGYYHQPRFGRPALALDLMEEFRPLLADSAVLQILNTGVVSPSDFLHAGDAVSLASPGRRRVIQAYERRMDQLVTHPVFGYRISYRRVLEVQARLFGRFLLGEIEEYPEFRTR